MGGLLLVLVGNGGNRKASSLSQVVVVKLKA